MLKARCGFGEIGYGYGCADNFYGTERMGRWLCPASKAETTFFSSAIVLNDKGIVLGQFRTLYVYTRPATRLTIGRFELSRRWANDGDTALCHGSHYRLRYR